MDDVEESDELGQATGLGSKADGLQLNRLVQLSGLSDPVYVEAYVTVRRGTSSFNRPLCHSRFLSPLCRFTNTIFCWMSRLSIRHPIP